MWLTRPRISERLQAGHTTRLFDVPKNSRELVKPESQNRISEGRSHAAVSESIDIAREICHVINTNARRCLVQQLSASPGAADPLVCPTGIKQIDDALGSGGFPKGRISEVYGSTGSGKTTVALHAIATAQRNGGLAAYIDLDHALTAPYATRIGVNADQLLVTRPRSLDDALYALYHTLETGRFAIVVVDSLASLVSPVNGARSIAESNFDLRDLLEANLPCANVLASQSNTCLLVTNQVRTDRHVLFGRSDRSAAVEALENLSSIRIRLHRERRTYPRENDDRQPLGTVIRARVEKNRGHRAFVETNFVLTDRNGVDLVSDSKSAGSMRSGGEGLGSGEDSAMQAESCNASGAVFPMGCRLEEQTGRKPPRSESEDLLAMRSSSSR